MIMTYQRDPEQRGPRDFIRREDGSFSGFALIVGIVAVVLLGFLLLRPGSGTGDRQVTSSRTEAPSKTQPTPTTPTPAPTPSK
jgi:hypothetical protein